MKRYDLLVLGWGLIAVAVVLGVVGCEDLEDNDEPDAIPRPVVMVNSNTVDGESELNIIAPATTGTPPYIIVNGNVVDDESEINIILRRLKETRTER